jgi:hypothetical protein
MGFVCRFCDRMGSAVFGFVKTEVDEKSAILESLQKNDSADKFASLNSMIAHEEGQGLLKKQGYVSGCRTLLRLHRGMGETSYTWFYLLQLYDYIGNAIWKDSLK